jgi:hypothetical protein
MQGFLFIKHINVGGHTLVGRFSGIWTQSGIVIAFKCATVYRHFGEAAVPEGECGPCPVFASVYTPAFALQLRKITVKPQVGIAEKRLTEDCWARFVWSTWWPFHGRTRPVCWPSPPLACASDGLGHPSVRYPPSCRNKGFPHQPTLSRNSRLGIWCGRQIMELLNPREFAYYWCTEVHQ